METRPTPQLHRITEVGARLSMSRSSIYREIEAGHLQAVQIGRSLRVTSDELFRYISSLSVKNSERTPSVTEGEAL